MLDLSDGLIVFGVCVAFMFGSARTFTLLELSTRTRCLMGVTMLAAGLFWAYRLMAADEFLSRSFLTVLALGLIGFGINQTARPWRIHRGMSA